MRLDKYLKVSRIIKRRTVAKDVCDGGKVKINGKYYDISKITDKKDMTIFEVDYSDESEVIKTDSVDKNYNYII